MKMRMLSLLIAATLAAGAAQASDKTPAPAAATPQQQAARAEIDRLVKRIEELSGQLGDGQDVRVIVKKGHRGGPEAFDEDSEWEEHGDGPGRREVHIKRLGPGDAPMALPGGEMPFRHGPGLGIVLGANTAAT